MAITYSWNFNPLEIVYNEDVMVDVINVVHWQYVAKDEDSKLSVQSIGTVNLPTPSPESFTAFADVTKEQVTMWVETALGADTVLSMQQSLATQIESELHPLRGTVSPPWS